MRRIALIIICDSEPRTLRAADRSDYLDEDLC